MIDRYALLWGPRELIESPPASGAMRTPGGEMLAVQDAGDDSSQYKLLVGVPLEEATSPENSDVLQFRRRGQ